MSRAPVARDEVAAARAAFLAAVNDVLAERGKPPVTLEQLDAAIRSDRKDAMRDMLAAHAGGRN